MVSCVLIDHERLEPGWCRGVRCVLQAVGAVRDGREPGIDIFLVAHIVFNGTCPLTCGQSVRVHCRVTCISDETESSIFTWTQAESAICSCCIDLECHEVVGEFLWVFRVMICDRVCSSVGNLSFVISPVVARIAEHLVAPAGCGSSCAWNYSVERVWIGAIRRQGSREVNQCTHFEY